MNAGSLYKKLLLSLFLLLFLSSIYAVIAIYGDSQGNNDIHKQIVEAIIKYQPDITFHLGDLTAQGKKQEEYDEFFSCCKPLTDLCPLYPVKGNHDASSELFLKNFPFLSQTYYTVEYDSLLFIILDSTLELSTHSEQFNWLIETFNSNPLKPKIILMHHPIFSSGYHSGNEDWALYLPALFASNKVIAVFSGHDHNYEHLQWKNLNFFISGGAGGSLRPSLSQHPYSKIFCSSYNYLILNHQKNYLNCTAYSLDGEIIDKVVIFLDF